MAKPKYRRKKENKIGLMLVLLVVVLLIIVVSVPSMKLLKRVEQNNMRIANLEQQIADEEKRSDEIEEYTKYTKTKKYVEEVARDKLGLVYDGEIVFRNENNN